MTLLLEIMFGIRRTCSLPGTPRSILLFSHAALYPLTAIKTDSEV